MIRMRMQLLRHWVAAFAVSIPFGCLCTVVAEEYVSQPSIVAERTPTSSSYHLRDTWSDPTSWNVRRYRSVLTTRIDSVWMAPTTSAFRSEILDPGSGNVVVSQDLDFGLQLAPQVTLRSFLIDGVTAEFIFLGGIDWESTASFDDVPPTPNLDADVKAEASLLNFELNWVSDASVLGTRWIAGLRYLEYEDSLTESYILDIGAGPVNETAFGEANNRLFGPQLGLELDVAIERTLLQFGGKLGFLNNRADQAGPAYVSALVIDGTPESTFNVNTDHFTLSAEIDALIQHSITSNCAVHVGYQGLFLNRVIQSASQVGSPSQSQNLWLHGLVLGGQWIY
ncbi:MAG: BBP7 family outer membrane beta-barrel protein [Planctomycetota bacterium]